MKAAVRNLAQLEMLILLAVSRLNNPDERSLASIFSELERNTARDVLYATVYTSLESMTRKGLLTSREHQRMAARPGRPKTKLYSLTPLGEDELNLALRDVFTMVEGVKLWSTTEGNNS
jgi:DNA-binding PadR family transcriptional regulator